MAKRRASGKLANGFSQGNKPGLKQEFASAFDHAAIVDKRKAIFKKMTGA
jgi:hypothetical protein